MALRQPSVPSRDSSRVPAGTPRSGVIHVNTWHASHYTVIGNHLLQHRELSATAIGIAGHIQSLPGGAPVGIRALMHRFPEGEKRISAALRELERCGYLERRTERLATGRVVTRTYSYNKPRTGPDEPPPPPPPPPPSCSEPAPDPAPAAAAGRAPDSDAAAAAAPCLDADPALAPDAALAPGPGADREPDLTSDQGAGAAPALGADPTPDPAPCPCSAPDREPTPTSDPTSDPTADPAPDPAPAPAPGPDVDPGPAADREPTPTPTPDPAPDREPTPTPDADADPGSCPAPDREPHSGPTPDSGPTPGSGPSWDPARGPAAGVDTGAGPGHGTDWGPVSGSWPAPRHLHPGAADLLAGLRHLDPRLLLAARDVERLAPGVSTWLDRGADPEAVGLALTTNLPEPMRSPAAVLAYRLKELLPPHLPQASASKPARRPDPFQTCDGCERAFRSPHPGRCRDCPPPPAAAA
ncbi:hypothetical protein OV450_2248 [Actinobacteria bacterium OV450]|nr:hypothetical protein OV450_2248 [Actinobacteria bacterium OV450]